MNTKNNVPSNPLLPVSQGWFKRMQMFFLAHKGRTAFLYGLLFLVLLLVPRAIDNQYYLGIVNYIILYSILCMGLNLILGYTGLLSLGHAAFYGLGGYTTAILMTRHGFGFLPVVLFTVFRDFSTALRYFAGASDSEGPGRLFLPVDHRLR